MPRGPRTKAGRFGAALSFLGLVAAFVAPRASASDPPLLKIYTEEPGVYRVRHEDLTASGLPSGGVASDRLGLTTSGRPVPVHLNDGGDGWFGPGDSLEFVAERLAGETSVLNEHTPLNVYLLHATSAAPARIVSPAATSPGAPAGPSRTSPYRVVRHVEKDALLLRFSDYRRSDLWYWAKLAYLDAEPFRFRFELAGLDDCATGPVAVRVALRGLSAPTTKPPGVRDHRVEVLLGGRPVAAGEWDGTRDLFTLEVPGLVPAALLPGENVLEVRVPSRPGPGGKDPLVDVVALNWIELEAPRTGRLLEDRQELIHQAEGGAPSETLETAGDRKVAVYGAAGGTRIEGARAPAPGGAVRHRFPGLASEESFWAVPDGTQLSPVAVEPVRLADLASTRRQADYVVVVHPRLRQAVEPLAELHRSRGLSVAVVDVREIYDEFNHGILHPRAIRDFLAQAVARWRSPAPRFVLLAGDASWDTKNREVDDALYPDTVYRTAFKSSFFKIRSTPYPEKAKLNHRNLVPTFAYDTYDGHAAGDNWFAALGEPGDRPRVAIGRFPVTEPEEVAAIVAKTVSYVRGLEVGPWRRRVLWISNGLDAVRNLSDTLSRKLAASGLSALKVFPDAKEKDNAVQQQRIRQAFDDGQLLVHFHGHGGRFIWLTALPRYREANDLFTLEDLDKLAPTKRNPIVLSMTCYSAPFDHPGADSIGEKLLRLPGRGAAAVVAASWRNAPTLEMSRILLEELSKPGTVGEALMRAKRRNGDVSFREQYNLLGDPALPVGLPTLSLGVAAKTDASETPTVEVSVPEPRFDGRALVEWFDDKGDVVESTELAVRGGSFSATLSAREKAPLVRGVSVYAWDEKAGIDGMGGVSISPKTQSPR